MKRILSVILAICLVQLAGAQSRGYQSDVKTVFETIKTNVFKNGYQYVMSFEETNHASMVVKPSTDYLVFYVYDNTNHPVPDFKAFLMTPNKEQQKKYTASPDDLGQVGSARVQRLKFKTQTLGGKDQLPVKLEANPKATIYIFNR